MENLYLLDAVIRFKATYTCNRCGKKEIGDQVSFQMQTQNPDFIKQELKERMLRANDMPIGWANSYASGLSCTDCK